VSEGGTHEHANLQWTTLDVNLAKRNLSQPDFVALCQRVVQHVVPQ
jgi:hypothetical protein